MLDLKSESKGFYKPKEVLETLISVLDNPKFNGSALANHLLILSASFSRQPSFHSEHENKFCQELYHLCQNHISYQKVNRKKTVNH